MINQQTFKLLWGILFLGTLFSLCTSCEDITESETYKRPDWLPGKLYTTVTDQENLTWFAECLRLTGLDTILDVSGSWSVFAPTDEAMEQYLFENQYASISDIPLDELERITEFHVIQNPWTLEQLQSLSANGWRTADDDNWYSYAYKRQTMFKNSVEKYWIKSKKKKEMIVMDSTISDGYKKVFIQSRKYVPIFYDKYLDVNDLASEDYSFYFNRVYERGNTYFAEARIIQNDILAENGFVHIIDRVVNPMLNAKELLEKDIPDESYKLFLELVYWYYPTFVPNMTATYNQPAVRHGGLIDTLWDVNYAELKFDLHKERIGFHDPITNETLVRHNGLFAPTDDAFKEFIDNILTVKSGFPHWPDSRSLPQDIVDIVVSQHFKSSPMYPSTNQYREIFREDARFRQNEEDIIRKEFGSNCTFIGLDTYIPDRVFTSVTGPVFLRPRYSIFRRAMLYSGVHDIIAKHQGELYFFPIPDNALKSDSSLILSWIDKDKNTYNFKAFDRSVEKMRGLGRNIVRNWILNHVGTPVSSSSDKETIRTLSGKYITWDHSNNTIRGAFPSTFGYRSKEIVTCFPAPLNEPADNGKVWSVNHWFNFGN